ncbi:MAG: hypothetical protein ACLFPL_03675 [Candidatus Nanoarchaeia archaeon]
MTQNKYKLQLSVQVMGIFFKDKKTIKQNYKEALELAVQTFKNFPNLELDFSSRQVNEIIIPRMKNLIKAELAKDAENGHKGLTNPVVELAKIIIDKKSWKSTQEYKENIWQQLKVLVLDRYNKLDN